MADNNKISIDIEINASGQQQLNRYNRAFDSLRTAINNLSAPLNALDKTLSNLSGSINKLNDDNNSLSNTIRNVGTAFSTFKSIQLGLGEVLGFVKLQAAAANTALTGGISLILTFLPEIVNLVGSFFKGKEAVAQITDKMKGFNEVMKAANSDTANQTAKLNLLYKSATDVKNSEDARAESVRQLKKEYPGYFSKTTNKINFISVEKFGEYKFAA